MFNVSSKYMYCAQTKSFAFPLKQRCVVDEKYFNIVQLLFNMYVWHANQIDRVLPLQKNFIAEKVMFNFLFNYLIT